MKKILLLLTLILIAPPTHAADPALPPALQTLAAEGAQMKYLGRDLGFDGWIAVKDGQEQYFYVTPDGNAFVLGVLFNKNGRAVTFDQMRRLQGVKDPIIDDLLNAPSQKANLAPPAGLKSDASSAPSSAKAAGPRASKGEQFFAAVQNATHFPLGSPSAPEIYVFIDPLCPHCHDLLTLLDPAITAGRLRVQVVLVGALRPESGPLATAILTTPNPGAALTQHMKADRSLAPVTPVDPRLEAHLKILTDWGFDATPVTVYRAQDGQIKILPGLPKTVTLILNDLR